MKTTEQVAMSAAAHIEGAIDALARIRVDELQRQFPGGMPDRFRDLANMIGQSEHRLRAEARSIMHAALAAA